MSKTFKICHIDHEKIKKVYIFGSNDEIFSKSLQEKGIEIEVVKERIYMDDTIRRIKEKIFLNCNLNVSIPELYLMSVVKKTIRPEIVYNRLTQDDKLDLNKERLCTMVNNLLKEGDDILLKKDCEKMIKHKDNYTYDDMFNIKYIKWNQKMLQKVSIGQKVIINKNYDIVTNPFEMVEDSYLMGEVANFVTTQNKKLLFEYGNIYEDIIYLCTAEDVVTENLKRDMDEEYIFKLYFPELYIVYKVGSKEDMLEKRNTIIMENNAFIKKWEMKERNESIGLLYDLYHNRTSEIEKINSGVSKIKLTIHPFSVINFPLEILFKLISTTELIPLVKYNPGSRHENIYRLFTGDNISQNGKKIPILYVNNDYKKGKIVNKDIFSIDKDSAYYFSNGWHIKAIYSLFIGFIFSAATIWNVNLMFLQSYSWFIGAAVSSLTYYLLAAR